MCDWILQHLEFLKKYFKHDGELFDCAVIVRLVECIAGLAGLNDSLQALVSVENVLLELNLSKLGRYGLAVVEQHAQNQADCSSL